MLPPPTVSTRTDTLFPYPTLFRSAVSVCVERRETLRLHRGARSLAVGGVDLAVFVRVHFREPVGRMRLRLGAVQHAIAVGIARPAAGGGATRRGAPRGAQRQQDNLLFPAIHTLSCAPSGGMPVPNAPLVGAN